MAYIGRAHRPRKSNALNLLLLEPRDFVAPQRVQIGDRRLAHLRDVLRAAPGDGLRAGLLDGALGTATLLRLDADRAELAVALDAPPPPPRPVALILALPRPKVLRRALRAATMLGIKEIHLLHSWRVEKSYWQTPLLRPEPMLRELALALELAGDTVPPRVTCHRRFKPFVEDLLDGLCGSRRRLLAHPGATTALHEVGAAPGTPAILVIGPEGGFIPYEVDRLTARGFLPVTLGARVLSVEVALAAALGALGG